MTQAPEFWNTVYDNDTAPWVIGEPQPAIVALERAGAIRGRVLDPGCGAGEHTILLTRLGYDVLGVDLSPSAVDYARRNAEAQGVSAEFRTADAVRIGADPQYAAEFGSFDTVVDSALFHCFREDPQARAAYVHSLRTVLVPGGTLHLLALSDAESGFGPRIGSEMIRESFGAGWEVEDLRAAHYQGRAVPGLLSTEQIEFEADASGSIVATAWLARIRRI